MPSTLEIVIYLRDGVYSATCAALPGFFLCSDDLNKLESDIDPALLKFFEVQTKLQRQKTLSPTLKANTSRLVAYRELVAA